VGARLHRVLRDVSSEWVSDNRLFSFPDQTIWLALALEALFWCAAGTIVGTPSEANASANAQNSLTRSFVLMCVIRVLHSKEPLRTRYGWP